MVKNFGYIVPYRIRNGKLEVLAGIKQVLSFEAIAKQKIDSQWKDINFANPINNNGYVNAARVRIGTRFSGMLLPGGGKPCFCGGSSQGNELHEGAAKREFQEELNLQIDANAWNNKLEQVLVTSWGGKYFAVDVDRLLPTFDWDAHLRTVNGWAADWERRSLQQVSVSQENRFPELHQAVWLEAQQALRLFDSAPDQATIGSEITRFTRYVIERAGANVDDSVKAQFEQSLVRYMMQQDVADNAKALKNLVEMRRV